MILTSYRNEACGEKQEQELMAAAQRPDIDAMAPSQRETCVIMALEFGGCSHEDLVDWALVIQEVLDTRACDAAPGAAVRCVYEPSTVGIIFAVENETKAGIHERAAAVLAAVESVVPSSFDTDTATRSADRGELVPA